jgi:hypothetical protein
MAKTRRAPGGNRQKSTVVPASTPKGPLPRKPNTAREVTARPKKK